MNKKNQIEKMLKCICMDCRYFTRCNDDTMYGGETLSKVLRERCSTWKIGEAIYNAGYRKQSEGEWEKLDNDHFNCTHCGNIFALGSTATIYNVKRVWKFCPNCGAKMKGGAE